MVLYNSVICGEFWSGLSPVPTLRGRLEVVQKNFNFSLVHCKANSLDHYLPCLLRPYKGDVTPSSQTKNSLYDCVIPIPTHF